GNYWGAPWGQPTGLSWWGNQRRRPIKESDMQRMFIRMLWRLALLVLPLGAAALLMPSVAAAAQPSCGDVVTSNVTLTGNLDCSSSNSDGLIVGKNGITINLAGFTIIGPSNGSYEGINNTGDYSGGPFAGWNNVTVENGK